MRAKIINKCKKRIIAFFALVLLIGTVFASNATAASLTDVIIRFTSDTGDAFSGVSFSVYRVAAPAINNEFKLCEPFSSYPITIPSGNKAALWKDFAITLKGYISRDSIVETAKGTTGSDGIVVFSPGTAPWQPGIYLVLGTSITIDSNIITPQPAFFQLTGDEVQPLLVEPKYSNTPTDSEHPKLVNVTVIKKWKGNNLSSFPRFVDIQLLKDGTVWDTVRLNEDNEWTYCWKGLSASAVWDVVELTQFDEYTVSIRQDCHKFTITNEQKPTMPEDPSTPPPDNPSEPGKPTPIPPPTIPPTGAKLPQTGVFWWPIFIIAGIGLVCLALGLYLRRLGDDHS